MHDNILCSEVPSDAPISDQVFVDGALNAKFNDVIYANVYLANVLVSCRVRDCDLKRIGSRGFVVEQIGIVDRQNAGIIDREDAIRVARDDGELHDIAVNVRRCDGRRVGAIVFEDAGQSLIRNHGRTSRRRRYRDRCGGGVIASRPIVNRVYEGICSAKSSCGRIGKRPSAGNGHTTNSI